MDDEYFRQVRHDLRAQPPFPARRAPREEPAHPAEVADFLAFWLIPRPRPSAENRCW
jgi:hypothetical protein